VGDRGGRFLDKWVLGRPLVTKREKGDVFERPNFGREGGGGVDPGDREGLGASGVEK